MLLKIAQVNKSLLLYRGFRNAQIKCRLLSTKVEVTENEPVKFSTSGAARKTVIPVMKKADADDAPWYQLYSVLGSVTAFLLYFCVLREESDIDLEFNKTLYERIHGLEKEQLLQSYRHNKENGLSVVDIERRLEEIEQESRNAANQEKN